jgi:hypothetical protein
MTNTREDSIPVATEWLLDAVGDAGRAAIDSVFMIINPRANKKGTGFLLETGYLVTNEHVVRGCTAQELQIISSKSTRHVAGNLLVDEDRDLAVMRLDLAGGLAMADVVPDVGVKVSTWGYPLGYNGPAPLLAVGHLAGFEASTPEGLSKPAVRRLVVNAAFNGGNSGGPLFVAGDGSVIGVVVSKHAPIPPFLASAIQALASNRSGVVFTATDEAGGTRQFVESQVVAEVLQYFRDMTQVVIGEAIAASELIDFLSENRIPWCAGKK